MHINLIKVGIKLLNHTVLINGLENVLKYKLSILYFL